MNPSAPAAAGLALYNSRRWLIFDGQVGGQRGTFRKLSRSRGEIAWYARKQLRRIEFYCIPNVVQYSTHVGGRCEHVGRELPLDTEVPTVLFGRVHIGWNRQIGRKGYGRKHRTHCHARTMA